MGAPQVGLLPTDLFLETGQERVKISCKSPDIAFVFNSPQKYRQVLGNEIVPWNVACIQISLSLFLSVSLSHLLPPFTFSPILLIQGYLCWSRLAYLSQESSQILYQVVPSVFQTPIKNDSIFPKITPLFVWRYSTLHRVPLSTIVSPSH